MFTCSGKEIDAVVAGEDVVDAVASFVGGFEELAVTVCLEAPVTAHAQDGIGILGEGDGGVKHSLRLVGDGRVLAEGVEVDGGIEPEGASIASLELPARFWGTFAEVPVGGPDAGEGKGIGCHSAIGIP